GRRHGGRRAGRGQPAAWVGAHARGRGARRRGRARRRQPERPHRRAVGRRALGKRGLQRRPRRRDPGEGRLMAAKNRQWLLARRPAGLIAPGDFDWVEGPVPSPAEGEVLVRNQWLSCDPTQRAWIAGDTYLPAVKIGEVM